MSSGYVVVGELESDLCIEFVKQYEYLSLLNQFKSELFMFHVANERKANKQYHIKLSRMGVVAGVADYCIVYPEGRVAFIEFKRDAKSCKKLSPPQENFREMCKESNTPYLLTCSVEEAIDFLKTL